MVILVGYAIAVKTKVPKYGVISWVTQLVVHENYRRADVAKTLLFSIWSFSSHFAWGLVTANPYAVRALEKATRRRCVPSRIKRNCRKLQRVGEDHVPYVNANTEIEVNQSESRINTQFFLDHSEIPEMIARVTGPEKPWLLGDLPEGWEWFAFTFHDQEQIGLTRDEIEMMLSASDQVTQQAYSRMMLGKKHAWAKFTPAEVQFIIENCELSTGSAVLDLGCGMGRHLNELAKLGFSGVGVDYVRSLISKARAESDREAPGEVRFLEDDVRYVDLGKTFDSVICLYDVIGTYAGKDDNLQIIRNIARHLRDGGLALLSVMNLEATRASAKNRFSLVKEPDRLLSLAASNTMEQTGNVFDPDLFLLDTETDVVYRKEQFAADGGLPIELIVRDRRFTKTGIETLCAEGGLEVVWSRYVRAGAWIGEGLAHEAKEILLLCRKGSSRD